jgi:hypothetical protein
LSGNSDYNSLSGKELEIPYLTNLNLLSINQSFRIKKHIENAEKYIVNFDV